mmetsp:Transcript_856/g.2239  ORF Transcript_856/g.2239 Transcript_856/m.2239 type:complete len:222 (-) Transcript_856:1027-1692(-)
MTMLPLWEMRLHRLILRHPQAVVVRDVLQQQRRKNDSRNKRGPPHLGEMGEIMRRRLPSKNPCQRRKVGRVTSRLRMNRTRRHRQWITRVHTQGRGTPCRPHRLLHPRGRRVLGQGREELPRRKGDRGNRRRRRMKIRRMRNENDSTLRLLHKLPKMPRNMPSRRRQHACPRSTTAPRTAPSTRPFTRMSCRERTEKNSQSKPSRRKPPSADRQPTSSNEG